MAIDRQKSFAQIVEELQVGGTLALQRVDARRELIALPLELRLEVASFSEHAHACGGS